MTHEEFFTAQEAQRSYGVASLAALPLLAFAAAACLLTRGVLATGKALHIRNL